MIRNAVIASATALCAFLTAAPPATGAPGPSDGWQRVGSGVLGGMSGMALVEGAPVAQGLADAVVVRGNKGDHESRVATLRLRPGQAPAVSELPWLGVLPAELGALDAVPGRPGHYIAVAGRGDAYHIVVADGRVVVQGSPSRCRAGTTGTATRASRCTATGPAGPSPCGRRRAAAPARPS